MKVYTDLEECKNLNVVKMARTNDSKYLGIRMTNGVIFFNIGIERTPDKEHTYPTMEVLDNWDGVPNELLEALNLKLDLVSTDVSHVFTREK